VGHLALADRIERDRPDVARLDWLREDRVVTTSAGLDRAVKQLDALYSEVTH
jgi:hypothetical protein